jgi:hypothetical protein
MEALQSHTAVRKGKARSVVVLLFSVACLLPTAGCVTTESLLHFGNAPADPPCQVVVNWTPEVVFTPDVAHGGTAMPGLTGRLYLFGQQIKYPEEADGSLIVDLYDETPGHGNAPVLLEQWRVDNDTLKKLKRRDRVGWGYTFFLPWATYKPEITTVHLRLRYQPAKGLPLYADNPPMTFHKGVVSLSPVEAKTQIIQPARAGSGMVQTPTKN